MSSLYLYFFKQYKNSWKNLSLRIRIEIIILFIIYFSYFTTKSIQIFNEQLTNQGTTSFGLLQFVLHVLLFFILQFIPFVHFNLLPRQKNLAYFRTFPLNRINTFWLLFFLHYKYQVIGLLVILPVFTAFLFTVNILYSIYFIAGIVFYQGLLIIFTSVLTAKVTSKIRVFVIYFVFLLIAFSGYFILYFYTNYYFLFDTVVIFAALIYLIPTWNFSFENWDTYIKITSGYSGEKRKSVRLFSYAIFRKLPFPKISPLLAKEMLNYIRNRKFIRLQILLFIIFSLIIFILYKKVPEDFEIYSMVISLIFLWQHFSLQFNEKYLKGESAVFIKTLPIKYYQLWVSKFISEFLFVLVIITFLAAVFLIKGIPASDMTQPILILFLFSFIVLTAIINFKIIFFDNPRFAGYAYHFFVIFVSVMSFNYYLVGPVITLVLLIYFTYYSYREFAR